MFLATDSSAKWRDRVQEYAKLRNCNGFTADEAAIFFNVSHNTVAPRITELKEAGELQRTKLRRYTRAGTKARVLVARRYYIGQ